MAQGIEIKEYSYEMNAKCIALEKLCPQGKNFKVFYKRTIFHKRAENFDKWKILTAEFKQKVVGVIAFALKNLKICGNPIKGSYFFDWRVHPDFRRSGVGMSLAKEGFKRAIETGSQIEYFYGIDDNEAMQKLAENGIWACLGSYKMLVWPVFKHFKVNFKPRREDPKVIHEKFLNGNKLHDFYSNPFHGGTLQGFKASYSLQGRASCSIWSNEGIIDEIILDVPRFYTFLTTFMKLLPFSPYKNLAIPRKGIATRSWVIFDFHASNLDDARELVGFVNNIAKKESIEYLYILNLNDQEMVPFLKKINTRIFSPSITNCLFVSNPRIPIKEFKNIYVDIRDV